MGSTWTAIAATTAAVTNRFVTTTNMIVGAYTVANPSPVWGGGCLVTCTHTQVGGVTDTLGTIDFVGTGPSGQAVSETLTPVSASTVTGTKIFRTITSVTGVGWVINTGNDTIVMGCAAGSYPIAGSGTLRAIVVNTTAAAAITVSDARGTIATLKSSIAEGTYYYDLDVAGWLKVATTSTNDITVVHTASLPISIA